MSDRYEIHSNLICDLWNKCLNKHIGCHNCNYNKSFPVLKNNYAVYIPVCLCGYKDCIHDPAYLYYSDPEWYTKTYGNIKPIDLIKKKDYCINCHGDNYDDEDK